MLVFRPKNCQRRKQADVAWLAPILTPFFPATKGQQRPQTQGMVAEHQAQPTSSKATTATRTPKPQTIHLKFECFKSQSCETNETYKQLVWIHFTLCEYINIFIYKYTPAN